MKRHFFYAAAIFLALTLNSGTLHAQNFWQQTNGPYGGNVYCVAADSTGTIYAGLDCGEIDYTTDNGADWKQWDVGDSVCNIIISIFVESPNNIYATSDSEVFHTTDHGEHWFHADNGLWGTSQFANIIYKIVENRNGDLFAATERGIFKSTNAGEKWTVVDSGVVEVWSIIADSKGTILAGTFQDGVVRSTDDGKSWVTTGYPTNVYGGNNAAFVFAQNPANLLFVGTERGGIMMSTDDGVSWNPTGLPYSYVYSLAIDSNGTIFAGTNTNGEYRSTDNGISWNEDSSDFLPLWVKDMAIDKYGHILAATIDGYYGNTPTYSNGLLYSTDTGMTWNQIGCARAYVQCFAFDSNGAVYSGAHNGVQVTRNNGGSWTEINKGLSDKVVRALIIDNQNNLFAGTDSGVYRYSSNGTVWQSSGMVDSTITTFALASNGDIYAGTGLSYYNGLGVYVSKDHGRSWQRTNDAFPEVAVSAIIIDSNENLIVGTVSDGIWLSKDGGKSWSQENNYSINCMVKDNLGYLYAGTFSGVLRSTDKGVTWINYISGLGNDTTIISLALDHNGTIYAGTVDPTGYYSYSYVYYGKGVYESTDHGLSWQKTGSGLPNYAITALGVGPQGFIYAGTSQSGAFRSINAVTSVKRISPNTPSVLTLQQNYPNPFSPSTNISFSLPHPGNTTLKIYDALGKEVATVLSGSFNAGEYSIPWEAKDLPDGIYYYRLTSGATTETKKLVLMK